MKMLTLIRDDEVICVDDDENDSQVVESNGNHVGMWICNNNNKILKPNVFTNQVNEILKKGLQTQRLVNITSHVF